MGFTKITVLPCEVWNPIVVFNVVPGFVKAAPILIEGTKVPEDPKVNPIPVIGTLTTETPAPIEIELPIDIPPVSDKNIVLDPTGTVSIIDVWK